MDYTSLLTKKEYNQLQVFNKLDDFNKIYKELQSKNSSYTKDDALWSVYNVAKLEYETKRDTVMLSVVLDRMTDILLKRKDYNTALKVFSSSLYLILFNYDIERNIFNLHLNKRRITKLNKILKHTNTTYQDLYENFDTYIKAYVPYFYNEIKVSNILKEILKLKTI